MNTPAATVHYEIIGPDLAVLITPEQQVTAGLIRGLAQAIHSSAKLRATWHQVCYDAGVDPRYWVGLLAASDVIAAGLTLCMTPEQADDLRDQLDDRYRPTWCPTHETWDCEERQVCER